MRHVQAIISFSATSQNTSRKGQFGAWRIVRCDDVDQEYAIGVAGQLVRKPAQTTKTIKVLVMPVDRLYRPGVLVDPLKLLKRYQSHVSRNSADRGIEPDMIMIGGRLEPLEQLEGRN